MGKTNDFTKFKIHIDVEELNFCITFSREDKKLLWYDMTECEKLKAISALGRMYGITVMSMAAREEVEK